MAKYTELKVTASSDAPSVVVGSFFNGMLVPAKSSFDLYQNKHNENSYFLHGENDTLEYNGYTGEEENNDYIVGIYNPKEKTIEMYKAPMVYGKVTSLDSRVHKGPKIKSRGVQNFVQRTALGEAFGTKKAKAAIANLEKNRIDSEKLQDMELDIVDNVKELTAELPTRQQMESSGEADRPIPPVNESATRVEDVYSLHGIIPKKEWDSIRVNAFFEEEDAEKRTQMLPFARSAYVAKTLPKYVSLHNTEKVQMLYYASLLMGVYFNRRERNKTSLMEKLGNKPSEVLVDGILERFAVSKATNFGKSRDRSYYIDPYHEDKLLCYLFALLFHIEGFTLELLPLANELNMKPSRMDGLLRVMGAFIKPISVGMAEAIGISKRVAPKYKVAVLKVPFALPPLVRRGAKR